MWRHIDSLVWKETIPFLDCSTMHEEAEKKNMPCSQETGFTVSW